MGTVFSYVLLVLVASLAAFAVFLFLRIMRIFLRVRRLEKMRGYETILYAALRKLGPERTLETLLPNPDPKILEEVLLRMGDEGAEGWKDKVIDLYRLAGFAEKRLRQFHSRLKARRADAARRLGRIADPGVVPQLEELLRDRREEVREAALYALGRIGTAEALQVMLEALDLGDRWTQEKVAETVEEAGEASRSLLVELLHDRNPNRRTFAAEVLGRVGGPEEASYLEEALTDEVVDVRARAADSLGKMSSHPSRAYLLEALEDEDWRVRSQVVKALGKIGNRRDAPRLVEALRDPAWWVRNNAAFALREMGEAGEAPLTGALWDEDRFARETAAQALEESSVVERFVDDLREGRENPEGERVVRRLAEIGCVGTIIQVLSDLSEPRVRERLAFVLRDVAHPELQEALRRTGGTHGTDGPRPRAGMVEEKKQESAANEEHGRESGRPEA